LAVVELLELHLVEPLAKVMIQYFHLLPQLVVDSVFNLVEPQMAVLEVQVVALLVLEQ
jgi:hypothetical protein